MLVAHLVIVQYADGALQLAVEEGVRAGTAVDAGPAICVRSARRTLVGRRGVLRGELGRTATVRCFVDGAAKPPQMVAIARIEGGLAIPLLGRVRIEASSRRVIEAVR